MKIYRRTFSPDRPEDVRAMRQVVSQAEINDDGSAMFNYMPLSDPLNGNSVTGKRMRCPAGADIYTPYGWNMLRQTWEAFQRGETVWMEVTDLPSPSVSDGGPDAGWVRRGLSAKA